MSLTLFAVALLLTLQDDPRHAVISVERIWDRAQHNAFTDLERFQGRLFCTFREGSGHVPGIDGTVRVIASDDGQNWESVVLLQRAGVDLRDPKLTVTADGRLMVCMGGSVYEGGAVVHRSPWVAFSDAQGERIGEPQEVQIDEAIRSTGDWLWRVTWNEGVGWGVLYQAGEGQWGLHLVRTSDGVHYSHVKSLEVDGHPNEVTLRFRPDGTMLALVRREGGDRTGILGRSVAPHTEWTWAPLPERLGGPDLVVLEDGTLLAASRFHTESGARTALFRLDTDGAMHHLLTLPSGGDTSYPGLVVEGERLLVSYYSSHEGRTSIYLATLRLPRLMDR